MPSLIIRIPATHCRRPMARFGGSDYCAARGPTTPCVIEPSNARQSRQPVIIAPCCHTARGGLRCFCRGSYAVNYRWGNSKVSDPLDRGLDREKDEAAKRLAQKHREVELGISQILRFKDRLEVERLEGEPIKLLEVNANTVPSGVMPLRFGAAPAIGVPFPTVIVEVTPGEFGKIQRARTPVAAGLVRRLRNSARNRLRETMTTPGSSIRGAAQSGPRCDPAKSWSSRRLQSDGAATGHVVTIPNHPGSWCFRRRNVSSRTTTTRTTVSSSPPPLTKNRRSVSNLQGFGHAGVILPVLRQPR